MVEPQMALYTQLSEVIRDGLELKIQCSRCPFNERADPADAKGYVGIAHALNRDGTQPEFSLERCLDGIKCPVCGGESLKVDAIKPLRRST
jgi:Zn finger protein HypA/HybF involved in hydrogenase expression